MERSDQTLILEGQGDQVAFPPGKREVVFLPGPLRKGLCVVKLDTLPGRRAVYSSFLTSREDSACWLEKKFASSGRLPLP